jgi:hypothetical protein
VFVCVGESFYGILKKTKMIYSVMLCKEEEKGSKEKKEKIEKSKNAVKEQKPGNEDDWKKEKGKRRRPR